MTKQGEPKTISEEYYVPNLKHNLVNVSQLTQKGYTVIFQGKDIREILRSKMGLLRKL